VAFNPGDDGEHQKARGYGQRGTLERWQEVTRRAVVHAPVAAVVAASFASPLLSRIKSAENRCLFIELASRTTGGKTTAQRLAASVYGHPYQTVWSWNSTGYAMPRLAGVLQHLPLVLNDTKSASSIRDWGSVVYQLCDGQSKLQGSVSGMRRNFRWHNTIISSGESRMSSLVKGSDGGAHVRVISITDPPLGAYDQRELAADITRITEQHHGHAGRQWLQWLAGLSADDLDAIEAQIRHAEDRFVGMAGEGDGHRLALDLAILDTVGRLAWQRLGLGEWADPIAEVAPGIFRATQGSDVATQAMEYVLDMCAAQTGRFNPKGGDSPLGGWLGTWTGEGRISIIKSKLDEMLIARQYSTDVVREWKRRGWIESAHRHTTKVVRLGNGKRARCVQISPETFRAFRCQDDNSDGDEW
jgi:hypothetical protein